MKRKFDKAEIIFNDSYESDGFEYGVSIINKLLKSHNLEININFLDDYGNDAILFEDPHDDDGEFAWEIKVEKI